MRIKRLTWDGERPGALAKSLRAGAEEADGLRDAVAEVITAVRERGDEALRELTARFDATETLPRDLRVPPEDIQAALEAVDPKLRHALELAAVNIREVAEAQMADGALKTRLHQGQEVALIDRPVASAGAYAPGGRAAYPSSVLMTCIPAFVAGVERVALVTPPSPDGSLPDAVLAAAAISGVEEVHRCGGAQAIAALAIGTDSIGSVDVIVGPGNAWVTEAKRQLYGTVGIDGLAGPSELVVVADRTTHPREVSLDAMAQAEHGSESPVFVLSPEAGLLDRVEADIGVLAPERPSVADALCVLVECPGLSAAINLADCLAPEHLELRFSGATENLAAERVAGCVFVGEAGATAFGDYVAGSNHVLPTGGAARFSGPLSVDAFMRRTAVVVVPEAAAELLAPAADLIARSEGLPVHGESARARTSREKGDMQVDS